MKFITSKELSNSKNKFLVLDIRSPQRYMQSHVDGSINIDVYDDLHNGDKKIVEEKLRVLPKDKPIVTVCNAGMTAQHASRLLESLGYKTLVLEHGMMGWLSSK